MNEKQAVYVRALFRGIERMEIEPLSLINNIKSKNEFHTELLQCLSLETTGGNEIIIQSLLDLANNCLLPNSSTISSTRFSQSPHKLLSPFSEIQLPDRDKTKKPNQSSYLEIVPLLTEREAMFPGNNSHLPVPVAGDRSYQNIKTGFCKEFEFIKSIESLLALLEKYCVSIPAPISFENQNNTNHSENLFDYSRNLAAIAVCFYDEWKEGSWKGKETEIQKKEAASLSSPCYLICGDMSGIQDFIFSIKTDEKVAKSLKGRSYYVQLLAQFCSQYIVDELTLYQANIIFKGGGNFYILIPHCKLHLIEKCKANIAQVLYGEELYMNFGWTEVALYDFKNFSSVWKSATDQVATNKLQSFRELGLQLFEPFEQRVENNDEFDKLTGELCRAKGYRVEKYTGTPELNWKRVTHKLGYTLNFVNHENIDATSFNDVTIAGKWKNFKFSINELPLNNEHEIIDFQTFAEQADARTGTSKLGVLKMDVDNLGRIFVHGFPAEIRTIGLLSALSRAMNWFFEGYMNTLLKQKRYKNELYTIFSGGDDFFLVGAWDAVFGFAVEVREQFRQFVSFNSDLTISAAILIVEDKFPVAQFAPLVNDRLDDAKLKSKAKDAINIFDQVLTWEEFARVIEIKNILLKMVNEYHESRAIIEKITKSSIGFDKLQESAIHGKIKPIKVWRLAYYLRDVGKSQKDEQQKKASKDCANKIVEIYETLVFNAMKGEHINPMLFPVAARWAEFATRGTESEF